MSYQNEKYPKQTNGHTQGKSRTNGQERHTNTSTGAVKHTQGRRTFTMQKYRMTLECWSDSRSSSTSLSANVKHSGNKRFTATSRLSNFPLEIQETAVQILCLAQNIFLEKLYSFHNMRYIETFIINYCYLYTMVPSQPWPSTHFGL